MLVMDDASMHKLDVIKKKINDLETFISMIPGDLTRYLQPLNVSINKPFIMIYRIENWNILLDLNDVIQFTLELQKL